jgi:hypothetical protein
MNPVDSNKLNISLKEIFFQKIKIAKTEEGLKEELKQCLSDFGKLITINFQVFDENKNRVDISNLRNIVNEVYWIELMIYWENGKTYQTKFTINNEFSEYEELKQKPPAKEIINLNNTEKAENAQKTESTQETVKTENIESTQETVKDIKPRRRRSSKSTKSNNNS